MDFYDKLEGMGLSGLLMPVSYKTPDFYNWDIVSQFLYDIIGSYHNGGKPKRVFVYGDYDVDGAMCAKIILDGLKSAGVRDISAYEYSKHTHLLDTMAATECIMGKYDYFIICDTGSSDLEILNRITSIGTRLIVLDHHVTEYTYTDFGDNIAIINTEIENSMMEDGAEQFRLSAGALCYAVLCKFFEEQGISYDQSIVAYATISLFADCMDMTNSLNRAIYFRSMELMREELPHLVLLFMNEYSAFNARYIGYWFSPRINSLFRSENFSILNMLLFHDLDSAGMQYCYQCVEEIYSTIRKMVSEVTDIIDINELDNFVLGDLYSADKYYDVKQNKLYNYTGLVANMISEHYGKTAVTYCYTDSMIKGSVRDLFARDYLTLFQQFCYAAGHQAAFSLKIRPFDFDDFLVNLKHIDKCLLLFTANLHLTKFRVMRL